jgi:hypothetical protein
LLFDSSVLSTRRYVGFPNANQLNQPARIKAKWGLDLKPEKSSVIDLIPLMMWKDNPHIACVAHYRDFVFGTWDFKPGQFFEDTFGQKQVSSLVVCFSKA